MGAIDTEMNRRREGGFVGVMDGLQLRVNDMVQSYLDAGGDPDYAVVVHGERIYVMPARDVMG